jgi:hypothetical protein
MEITIVGWHLEPLYDCADGLCEKPEQTAAYMVEYVGDYSAFNLCKSCANGLRYTIVSDKIDTVFRDLGL